MIKLKRQSVISIGGLIILTVFLPTQMGGCPEILESLLLGGTLPGVTNVTASEAYDLIEEHKEETNFIILDVRTPTEYAEGHIEGAINICSTCTEPEPFTDAMASLDTCATYLVHCKSGFRSTAAIQVMLDLGFTNIYHMNNGINQWIAEGYATVVSD